MSSLRSLPPSAYGRLLRPVRSSSRPLSVYSNRHHLGVAAREMSTSSSAQSVLSPSTSKKPRAEAPDAIRLEALRSAGWTYLVSTEEGEDIQERITKEYKFRNFDVAWDFMNGVAQEAKKLNHHPEWFNVYNKVNIELTTHTSKLGKRKLTSLDIELAEAAEHESKASQSG